MLALPALGFAIGAIADGITNSRRAKKANKLQERQIAAVQEQQLAQNLDKKV